MIHRRTNNFLLGAFALVLILTGQGMAVARAAPDASGQMVLCIGANTVLVYIDEDGQPTEAPHICPDCILTLADLSAAAHAAIPDQHVLHLHVARVGSSLASFRASTGFWSRAPPAVA